jgi:hypothetical protein
MFTKKLVLILSAAAVCCCLGTGTASAQPTQDTAVVTYEVESITQLGLAGFASLTIVAGTAGQGLPSVFDATGVTYDITTNADSDSKKLIGKINTAMPSNTVLSVNVTAPSGAVSSDLVALTTDDQDLVTGIDNVNEAGVAISFKLEATVAAGVIASATKTFTMTIVAS